MRTKALPAAIACTILVTSVLVTGADRRGGDRTQPQLESPIRIAQAENGNLLVSDYRRQEILTLDREDLSQIQSFRIQGRPLAVATAGGRIYVGNETTGGGGAACGVDGTLILASCTMANNTAVGDKNEPCL